MTYVFDDAGRMTSIADAGGTTTCTYTDAGQSWTATTPDPKTLTYTYDSAGRRTVLEDPDDGATTCSWDAASKRTSLVNPLARGGVVETFHRVNCQGIRDVCLAARAALCTPRRAQRGSE